MNKHQRLGNGLKTFAVIAGGLGALAYAGMAIATWRAFGKRSRSRAVALAHTGLDRFIPAPDILELQQIEVLVPRETVFQAVLNLELGRLPIARVLFRTRAALLGQISGYDSPRYQPLIEQALDWGWGLLAYHSKDEIIFGAFTRPWASKPVFCAVEASEFNHRNPADNVKIVWSIRITASGPTSTLLSTETRAVATDSASRFRFRLYWSFVRPGVLLIRWMALQEIRRIAASA